MKEKETIVIKENDQREERRSSGWVGLIIALVLLLLFFILGGMNMFGGQSSQGTGTPAPTAPTGNSAPTQGL